MKKSEELKQLKDKYMKQHDFFIKFFKFFFVVGCIIMVIGYFTSSLQVHLLGSSITLPNVALLGITMWSKNSLHTTMDEMITNEEEKESFM